MINELLGAWETTPFRLPSFLTLSGVFLFLAFLQGCAPPGETPSGQSDVVQLSIAGQTMGTSYHVKAITSSQESSREKEVKERIDQRLADFSKALSTWDPQSEISRFNASHSTKPFPVSPETLEIVKVSFELYRESGGLFDPTVEPLIELWGFGKEKRRTEPPSVEEIAAATSNVGMNHLKVEGNALVKTTPGLQVNFSAIAKGYGVDLIARTLESEGYHRLMVEIGGEVVVRGKNLKGKPWTIGVDSPEQVPGKRKLIEILALDNCAVATSGDYRNAFEYKGVLYSHILSPKTGWPIPESVKSVTVIAPNCMLADGAATAIMAMGAERGLEWAEGRQDLDALLFVKNKDQGFTRMETSGMKRFLVRREGKEDK